jgi:hypothetical protein
MFAFGRGGVAPRKHLLDAENPALHAPLPQLSRGRFLYRRRLTRGLCETETPRKATRRLPRRLAFYPK